MILLEYTHSQLATHHSRNLSYLCLSHDHLGSTYRQPLRLPAATKDAAQWHRMAVSTKAAGRDGDR